MFESLRTALNANLALIKQMITVGEAIRELIHPSVLGTSTHVLPSPFPIAAQCPGRIDWQVFDNCAAISRLYAVYERFVDDLVTEYIRQLPSLFRDYADLNISIRTHNRVAIGQILQKWSESGPYRHLQENVIIQGLSDGLSKRPAYTLLTEAFLIKTQNYRADAIRRLFSQLGFADCWAGVCKHSGVRQFMNNKRDATETPETLLHDIVEHRNLSAHSTPTTIIGSAELVSYVEFIEVFTNALADLVGQRLLTQCLEIGLTSKIGAVLKRFGRATGIVLHAGRLAVGDRLILSYKGKCSWGSVQSIKKNKDFHNDYSAIADEELGVIIDSSHKEGTELHRLMIPWPS